MELDARDELRVCGDGVRARAHSQVPYARAVVLTAGREQSALRGEVDREHRLLVPLEHLNAVPTAQVPQANLAVHSSAHTHTHTHTHTYMPC